MRVAPLGVLFALRFTIEKALGSDAPYLSVMNAGTIVVAFVWLLYSDIRISMHSLKATAGRALGWAAAGVAVYYVLVAPVILLSQFLR